MNTRGMKTIIFNSKWQLICYIEAHNGNCSAIMQQPCSRSPIEVCKVGALTETLAARALSGVRGAASAVWLELPKTSPAGP